MSKNDQLQNAIKLVRAEIASLGEQIRNTPEGNERSALEIRMKELMDQIGMEYVSNPDLKATPADAPKAAEIKLSIVQRLKLSYALNKKKYWAGLAAILGLAAGAAYYFVKVKNTQATVSSVLGMAEGAADAAPESTTTDTTEASASVFAKIGDAILKGGAAVKNFLVGAYHTVAGFVKNLFTKTNTEANNGGNNEAVLGTEAVPA